MIHQHHRRVGLSILGAASSMIAGGVLAGSSALAQPAMVPVERPPLITVAEFDAAPEADSITPPDVLIIGPTPCDSCDPLGLTDPLSPNFDPTVLAVYQENDNLPPPEGPGFDTCSGLSVTGPFWAGANDQCLKPVGSSGRDVANVETQIPAFTEVGQRYAICGRVGLIDTTGFVGDPNNPGGPLKTEDGDIWEVYVAQEMRVHLTGYFSATEIQCWGMFNFDTSIELGTFDQLRDCEDRYGLYQSASWAPIYPEAACESGEWMNVFGPGYLYIYVDPRSDAAMGSPGNQLCDAWYNIEIETLDASGACCIDTVNGFVCQLGLTPSGCYAAGGDFGGVGVGCEELECPTRACCLNDGCVDGYSRLQCESLGGVFKLTVLTCAANTCPPAATGACCFACTGTVVAPCPDPSGPVIGCQILTQSQCLAAGGLYVGDTTTCAQGVGGPCDCAGDVNGDGITNISDFNILAGSFGSGGPICRTRAQGDLNCDGVVNISDFNILAGDFGCGG